MKENQGINTSGAVVSDATETRNQPVRASMGPPKLIVAQQIQWLKGLFLLKAARPYIDMWKKLKVNMIKLTHIWHIIIDNKHILKLMNKVKKLTIVNKKQESLTIIFYAGVLHKSFIKWQEPL